MSENKKTREDGGLGMLRIDLQESLGQSTVDPLKLSSFQRILLTTDGTVTEILEAQFWEAIRIVKMFQDMIETNASVPYLEIGPGHRTLVRMFFQRQRGST